MTDMHKNTDDFDYDGMSRRLGEIPAYLPPQEEKFMDLRSFIGAIQFVSGILLKPIIYTASAVGLVTVLTSEASDAGD